jgi:hypothetical protein
MSFKKVPYRKSYKKEMPYPTRGSMLLPNHGCGPRCQVDYNPKDDGPWTTLQIMRILDGDQVEPHTCAMPRYYAIPLILINKHLAFYEAQCHADGTPLVPSSSGSIRQRELREYNYLWRLRYRFLKEIFDMNHEPRLNERWRYVGIHGYLYRMYNRFGHDVHQRYAYWREEIKERRVPYTTPDVADMGELPVAKFFPPYPPLFPIPPSLLFFWASAAPCSQKRDFYFTYVRARRRERTNYIYII